MKTFLRTMSEMADDDSDCPLPLTVIPNYMGINLCSVEAVSWTERDDSQLVSLTIHFIPDDTGEHARSVREMREGSFSVRGMSHGPFFGATRRIGVKRMTVPLGLRERLSLLFSRVRTAAKRKP